MFRYFLVPHLVPAICLSLAAHKKVWVEMADGIDAQSQDTVFVFARAVNGPPMPLAAQRLTVSDLPRLVRLDESMSMNAQFSLATARFSFHYGLQCSLLRYQSSGHQLSPDLMIFDLPRDSGDIRVTSP